jgi:hypothetical protein
MRHGNCVARDLARTVPIKHDEHDHEGRCQEEKGEGGDLHGWRSPKCTGQFRSGNRNTGKKLVLRHARREAARGK